MIAPPPAALTLPLRTARPAARIPVVPPAEVQPRFTADGGLELEQHLARTCGKIAAGIRGLIPRGKLEAVLLGGGYGRGEGGVLDTPAGERPYNDLEFYVCLRGNRHLNERRFGKALHVLGEILTPQAGVEVEFKITSLREFERGPVSMFSYDLMLGHRWLVGDEDLLTKCAHHRAAEKIPLSEGTRLMMNRCSGLLFAKEKLAKREFTAADADFVHRNLAKAQLAFGDAVLVAYGMYHWSVRERHRLLERLARTESIPWLQDARRYHAAGVEFKLRPQRSTATRESLLREHAPIAALGEKIWLWLEEKRLRTSFPSVRSYAESAVNTCPETSAARNVAVTFRALGVRPLLGATPGRHPRQRIFHALPLLLWEPSALESPELRRLLQRELQTPAGTFPTMMVAYRDLWAKVN
jgi:hypothetical protein